MIPANRDNANPMNPSKGRFVWSTLGCNLLDLSTVYEENGAKVQRFLALFGGLDLSGTREFSLFGAPTMRE